MLDILYLCEFAALNGGEHSLLSVLPYIRAAGLRVAVAAPAIGPLAEMLRDQGLEHLPLELPTGPDRARAAAPALDELLVRCRPRGVHANSLSMGKLASAVLRSRRLPRWAHLRDIVRLSSSARAALDAYPTCLAVSQAVADWHAAQGLDPARLRVAYNGVDLERFAPRDPSGWLHAQLGLSATVPLLVNVGQIALRKGQDVLLEALERLATEHPRLAWHALLVGARHSEKPETRAFEASLRQAASRPPLAGRITFAGRLAEMPRVLAEAAVYVHVARQEPLGRVLLEAGASGLAVVASEVGGTAEIFPPGEEAARLTPPDDPAGVAAALGKLLADRHARQALGQRARTRIAAAFGAQRAAARLLELYREQLG